VNREPTLDDLIGDEGTGAERQQLQHVHEMLLEAGPPPELSDKLEAGPTLGMTLGQRERQRKVKRRAMLLLAATLATVLVFIAGYAAANRGGAGNPKQVAVAQTLEGTSFEPHAGGALEVWKSKDGNNWPMTLTVFGLPQSHYEVYLVRAGKIWGSCGAFRVGSSPEPVTVTLTSPYTLKKGDTWVVTRPGGSGMERGKTVLRPGPVTA
jgi:hypothetical protein